MVDSGLGLRPPARAFRPGFLLVGLLILSALTGILVAASISAEARAQGKVTLAEGWQVGHGDTAGEAVTTDAANNIYLTGTLGGASLLLMKFNSSGGLIWQKAWSPTGYSLFNAGFGQADAVDPSGNIYVTGYTYNTTFPNFQELLLLKFNSNGGLVWQRILGGNVGIDGHGVAIDSAGNVLVTGTYSPGNDQYCSILKLECTVILVKFNSTGGLQWQRSWGAHIQAVGNGIAIDSGDNIYVTGWVSPDSLLLLKFKANGDLAWAKISTGPYSYGSGVAVDSSGTIYIAGDMRRCAFCNEAVILKVDSSGVPLWDEVWGDYYGAEAFDLKVDQFGFIHVAGLTLASLGWFALKMDTLGRLQDSSILGVGPWCSFDESLITAATRIDLDSQGNTILTGCINGLASSSAFTGNATIETPSFSFNISTIPVVIPNMTVDSPQAGISQPDAIQVKRDTSAAGASLIKYVPGATDPLIPIYVNASFISGGLLVVALLAVLAFRLKRRIQAQKPYYPKWPETD